jgi:hypothetical protein
MPLLVNCTDTFFSTGTCRFPHLETQSIKHIEVPVHVYCTVYQLFFTHRPQVALPVKKKDREEVQSLLALPTTAVFYNNNLQALVKVNE